ncbi:LysR family transcriptional regulator [Paraburkholderia madseniana]|jgi:DNA-binding transcriptional LysR family regulator|uniref:LysR family transcriptional regulator n=1 Tax=Paraburkholderia madseniana TaxID=2599607 RepID=A0A6N6WNP9_9BURK|nr:LysR family transcriptional regulator [Paraburkholderia madseniana]KAE8761501.1 LysR family transcriptional regulator [Paraburkholderia madseniana]
MDKLLALNTLLEVADAGGFSKAAQRLGVATSSVTRLMDSLEVSLGTALLTRTPRKVSLTDAGIAYVEQVGKVLDDLAEADESVFDSGALPVGSLRISVPSTYSRLRLAPHLAAFLSENPRVFLDVVVADHFVDLALDRIDVAIRIGLPDRDANVIVRRLANNLRYVVASHDYLERSGTPQTPQALEAHECLRVAYGGGYRTRQVWTFRRDSVEQRVEVRGHLLSNSLDLLLEAVMAGRGVALLPEWLVGAEIRAGRLMRLLETFDASPHQGDAVVYAAYLPNRRHSSKVRSLLQFLEARLHTSPEG